EHGFSEFGEPSKVLGVCALHVLHFSACRESFLGELSDGFEHPDTWFTINGVVTDQQVLVEQRSEDCFETFAEMVIDIAHRRCGVEATAALEDRYSAKHLLFRGLEKLVTPVDGRAQRLLS